MKIIRNSWLFYFLMYRFAQYIFDHPLSILNFLNLFANCNVTSVGFSYAKLSCLYIVYGKRLLLSPELRGFYILNCIVTHEIIRHLGSQYLSGIFERNMVLTCSVKNIFYIMASLHDVHVFQELRIRWYLLDCLHQQYINMYLVKDT